MNMPNLPHRPFLIGARELEPFVTYHPANDPGAEPSECVEDMAPGAAIVAFAGLWFGDHWPALLLGLAAGMAAVIVPALLIAWAVA